MDSIESIKPVSYSLSEVGFGYGVRYSKNYGVVHNVLGNFGLAIKLVNGKKILLGIKKIVK